MNAEVRGRSAPVQQDERHPLKKSTRKPWPTYRLLFNPVKPDILNKCKNKIFFFLEVYLMFRQFFFFFKFDIFYEYMKIFSSYSKKKHPFYSEAQTDQLRGNYDTEGFIRLTSARPILYWFYFLLRFNCKHSLTVCTNYSITTLVRFALYLNPCVIKWLLGLLNESLKRLLWGISIFILTNLNRFFSTGYNK